MSGSLPASRMAIDGTQTDWIGWHGGAGDGGHDAFGEVSADSTADHRSRAGCATPDMLPRQWRAAASDQIDNATG